MFRWMTDEIRVPVEQKHTLLYVSENQAIFTRIGLSFWM
jgi:hypothetical protein